MILKYRTRISALLQDYPKARTAFNEETLSLESNINKNFGNKCFYVILVTALFVALLYGAIFYIMHENSRANILESIEKVIM